MSMKLVITSAFFVLMVTIMLTPTFAAQGTYEIISTNYDSQLIKIGVPLYVPSDNTLPWGAVYGTVTNHVEGYPVIIQIYQNDDPVHFAQTNVNEDGSYEYKFRIKSVDGDRVVNVFEGNYDVKIFKTVKLYPGFSI